MPTLIRKPSFAFMSLLALGAITAMTLSGCGYHCTVSPSIRSETVKTSSANALVWVDQNGDFYHPDGRDDLEGLFKQSGKFCLAKRDLPKDANGPKVDYVRSDRILAVEKYMQESIGDKAPVCILVHGFNNTPSEARDPYNKLVSDMSSRAPNMKFIAFYWDGLTDDGSYFGALQIWNNSTGFSQMAGMYGLRNTINMLGKERPILILTHSRGASVALSSLSDPPFTQKFIESTTVPLHGIEVYGADKPALAHESNKIAIGMLAPAIGEIDFCKYELRGRFNNADMSEDNVKNYRVIPCKEIIIGYKNTDDTLRKYLGVENKFNATSIGCRTASRERIKSIYNQMTEPIRVTSIEISNSDTNHGFSTYLMGPGYTKFLDAVTAAVDGMR